jgi:hypothetical protein
VAGFLVAGCRGGTSETSLQALTEARLLASDLRIQFNKAADASNQAVMADTDAASVEFAREARESKGHIEADAAGLGQVLQSLAYPDETRDLERFRTAFKAYEFVDTEVLALAVENTNLKAQGLSFGPVRAAADRYGDALQKLLARVPAHSHCQAETLASRGLLAVREIQVLQAPHIAEPNDAAMTRLEADMAALEKTALDATEALAALVTGGARDLGAAARTELGHFQGLSAQLVALSRRNTNVRSLALSLRDKPGLSRACDDALGVLQDALAKRGLNATR